MCGALFICRSVYSKSAKKEVARHANKVEIPGGILAVKKRVGDQPKKNSDPTQKMGPANASHLDQTMRSVLPPNSKLQHRRQCYSFLERKPDFFTFTFQRILDPVRAGEDRSILHRKALGFSRERMRSKLISYRLQQYCAAKSLESSEGPAFHQVSLGLTW